MEKGAKWSSEIDDALEGTSFGIVCLTPDNLASPWIHFEAGALSKAKDAKIWTFLHGLTPADVPPPLGKFQHTIAEKEDTLALIKTINRRLGEVGGESLTERLLEENFETFWPQLKERLDASQKLSESHYKPKGQSETQRNERAILNEILESVRNQERRLASVEASLALRLEPELVGPEPFDLSKPISRIYFQFPASFYFDLKEVTLVLQKVLNSKGAKNRLEVRPVNDVDQGSIATLFRQPISAKAAEGLAIAFANFVKLQLHHAEWDLDSVTFWFKSSLKGPLVDIIDADEFSSNT